MARGAGRSQMVRAGGDRLRHRQHARYPELAVSESRQGVAAGVQEGEGGAAGGRQGEGGEKNCPGASGEEVAAFFTLGAKTQRRVMKVTVRSRGSFSAPVNLPLASRPSKHRIRGGVGRRGNLHQNGLTCGCDFDSALLVS